MKHMNIFLKTFQLSRDRNRVILNCPRSNADKMCAIRTLLFAVCSSDQIHRPNHNHFQFEGPLAFGQPTSMSIHTMAKCIFVVRTCICSLIKMNWFWFWILVYLKYVYGAALLCIAFKPLLFICSEQYFIFDLNKWFSNNKSGVLCGVWCLVVNVSIFDVGQSSGMRGVKAKVKHV